MRRFGVDGMQIDDSVRVCVSRLSASAFCVCVHMGGFCLRWTVSSAGIAKVLGIRSDA